MKQKDLPKKLLVRDQEYSVRFVRKFPAKAGLEPLDGYCDPEDSILYVRQGQGYEGRLSTLVHEALHALDDEWDVGLSHAQIYILEKAFARFLIDNGLLG